MRIRPATEADLPAVLELVPRLAVTGTPPGRDAAQIAASDREAIAPAIAGPACGQALLLAEDAANVIGFIHLKTVTDYFSQARIAHVADVAVAAGAEGRGVGKALISAAEAWSRECGYGMIQRLGYAAEWLKYVKFL